MRLLSAFNEESTLNLKDDVSGSSNLGFSKGPFR